MPQWLLSCYIQMLPRLQAEEQLRGVDTLQIASPYAKQYDRSRAVRRLQRLASGDQEAHGYHVENMSPTQERAAFAMVGLAVKTVKPN